MTNSTPLDHSASIEKDIRWILDTRHTVPEGQSYTDTYALRIVDYIQSQERKARKQALQEIYDVIDNVPTSEFGFYLQNAIEDRIHNLTTEEERV